MMGTEKIGRTTWITYLITATPIALFCAAFSLISIRFLFIEDVGPIEEPPLPAVKNGIIWFSIISLPIALILGFTIAHRRGGVIKSGVDLVACIPLASLSSLAV